MRIFIPDCTCSRQFKNELRTLCQANDGLRLSLLWTSITVVKVYIHALADLNEQFRKVIQHTYDRYASSFPACFVLASHVPEDQNAFSAFVTLTGVPRHACLLLEDNLSPFMWPLSAILVRAKTNSKMVKKHKAASSEAPASSVASIEPAATST